MNVDTDRQIQLSPLLLSRFVRFSAFLGLFLISLNLRAAVTSLSAIYGFMRGGIAGLNIEVLGTIPVFCFAIFGAMSASLARRAGLEKALIISMSLVAIGIGVRACLHQFMPFALFSVVALAGISFGNVLVIPALKKYFADRLGMAMAMFSVMITLSSGLPSAIAVPVASHFGWRVNVALWAVPAVLSVLPWLGIIAYMRKARATSPASIQAALPASTRGFRSPATWLPAWSLAVIFGVTMMDMYATLAWLPTYLVSQGVSRAAAGTALFIFSVIGIPHALIIPLVIGRMRHPIWIVFIAAGFQLVGYAGFLFMPHLPYLWAFFAGPGVMTINSALVMINLRTRSSEGSAALSTFMQAVGYVLAAAGPYLFGELHLRTGSWAASFGLLAVMTGVMLLCSIPANRPVYLED